MVITKIYPTTHFIKAYKSLPEEIKLRAKKREKIFKTNPFDPRLKTHKLKGRLRDYWSYSVDYQYRILFRFINDETVLYYDIGTHSVYK
ncbi:MAG: type II toxin-antitoxin system mRNA interferase toxin, RelE/StbE family [Candidatus Omnitrophica bacterium]|nr:type II toxin-antitoxin system mRNA interferase toxin, RelE/StbE family [Candidatus Omnitrophota bacterium]MCM8793801.1 type II toxin-antitoxin system mRNA interferase toxin, RelE/StbE family [Candidatus Omnitrophota bacterium]